MKRPIFYFRPTVPSTSTTSSTSPALLQQPEIPNMDIVIKLDTHFKMDLTNMEVLHFLRILKNNVNGSPQKSDSPPGATPPAPVPTVPTVLHDQHQLQYPKMKVNIMIKYIEFNLHQHLKKITLKDISDQNSEKKTKRSKIPHKILSLSFSSIKCKYFAYENKTWLGLTISGTSDEKFARKFI